MNFHYRYEQTGKMIATSPSHSAAEYRIVEVPTGNVIEPSMDHNHAHILTRKLNSGTGFRGFTPEFFLHKIAFRFTEEN